MIILFIILILKCSENGASMMFFKENIRRLKQLLKMTEDEITPDYISNLRGRFKLYAAGDREGYFDDEDYTMCRDLVLADDTSLYLKWFGETYPTPNHNFYYEEQNRIFRSELLMKLMERETRLISQEMKNEKINPKI
eukprot:UN03189